MQTIFVYGTLMFPEVVNALCGKQFVYSTYTLNGYQRVSIVKDNKKLIYPGIIPCVHASVHGLLLHNVDMKSFQILSYYEGFEYECISVNLGIKTFVWKHTDNCIYEDDWDIEYFRNQYLTEYLKNLNPYTSAIGVVENISTSNNKNI